ncbi:NAD(P)/FAD-dependent oxidoreductase [Streptococcus halotolerans]|uniref:NAD(P)/FAD-dependent oxidoreductase n=1 Tax=Streptococcus halotolerans TaxID=1814128 RepID=UPI0007887A1F|nr:NAD(P)/FAD-dependent oxidoreductase [Streptococcus halotolerans]
MTEVVVLGAGYAGLKTVRDLQKQSGDFHITLIDRNSYHYEATELHEIASGTHQPDKITFPIVDAIDTKKVTFLQDKVEKVDCDAKTIQLEKTGNMSYDYLVISLGFRSEGFGIPGVVENALQMVDVDSANQVHEHVLSMMKKYRETKDANLLKLVICGAGFTGIELAGAFADERSAYAEIAGVKPEEISITCVEAMDSILPMFDRDMANYAMDVIQKRNITLMLGAKIKEIQDGKVVYTKGDDEAPNFVEAGTIVWTTGVSGSQVMEESGFEQRRGRVVVQSDLRHPHYETVYVIGDVSAFMNPESNRPYPTTAQIATQMGKHTAKNLAHQLRGEATEDFIYNEQGTVASIGNTHGLGKVGKMSLKGYPASVMKKVIVDKSLVDMGGLKELLAKGRFDFYH